MDNESLLTLKKSFLVLLISFFLFIFIYPVGYFVLETNEETLYHSASLSKKEKVEGVVSYIINLERSRDRYDYVKNSVADIGFEVQRIEAVDGTTLSQEKIDKLVDIKSYKSFLGHLPKKGTIGCSLSHIKTWEKFLESDFEFALIFEDDVSFNPAKLKYIVGELITNSSRLWDLVTFEIQHRGSPLKIKQFDNGQKLVAYLTEVTHAGAYIINRHAAQNLLSKALPIKMPVDHYFTRSWELDIKFTGVQNPRIAYQTFGDSDINITKSVSARDLSIKDRFLRCMYKLQSYMIRIFHNSKIFLLNKEE